MGSTKRRYTSGTNIELTALSIAARRAGMTYGKFIIRLTAEEKHRIIREYKEMLNYEPDNSPPCTDDQ